MDYKKQPCPQTDVGTKNLRVCERCGVATGDIAIDPLTPRLQQIPCKK